MSNLIQFVYRHDLGSHTQRVILLRRLEIWKYWCSNWTLENSEFWNYIWNISEKNFTLINLYLKIFAKKVVRYDSLSTRSRVRKSILRVSDLNFSWKFKYLNEIDLAKESISQRILMMVYSVNKWSSTSKFDSIMFFVPAEI